MRWPTPAADHWTAAHCGRAVRPRLTHGLLGGAAARCAGDLVGPFRLSTLIRTPIGFRQAAGQHSSGEPSATQAGQAPLSAGLPRLSARVIQSLSRRPWGVALAHPASQVLLAASVVD